MSIRICKLILSVMVLAMSFVVINCFAGATIRHNKRSLVRRTLHLADPKTTQLLASTLDGDDKVTFALNTISADSTALKPVKDDGVKPSLEDQYALSPQQLVYVVLTCIFVSSLLIADIVGVKLFEIPLPFEIFGHKSIEHSCGVLIFPITFLLGDVINEYFGPKAATRTVYIGLAMSMFVFLVINLAQALPYLDKPFNVSKESFDTIFGSAKLIYFASVTAYFIGSLSDIYIFGVIKRYTKGRFLWLRAVGSTLMSQVLDSFFVSYIAFSLGKLLTGQTPASFEEVMNIAVTGYGLKFCLGIAMTPFLYMMKYLLSTKLGLKAIPASTDEEVS